MNGAVSYHRRKCAEKLSPPELREEAITAGNTRESIIERKHLLNLFS